MKRTYTKPSATQSVATLQAVTAALPASLVIVKPA